MAHAALLGALLVTLIIADPAGSNRAPSSSARVPSPGRRPLPGRGVLPGRLVVELSTGSVTNSAALLLRSGRRSRGCTSSSPSPSSTGSSTAGAPRPGRWLTPSSRHGLPQQLNPSVAPRVATTVSTTSTWASPMAPTRLQPDRRHAAGALCEADHGHAGLGVAHHPRPGIARAVTS